MHAWEAIQKTLNYIEDNIADDIEIEQLADIASLSLFYYQRLFTRLVKKPVREYIKLRRLARACDMLKNKDNPIIEVAIEYGFGSRETFTRTFKDAYGITPKQYRDNPVGLENFDKPDLLLNYYMIDENVPLISEGLVLEYNRKTLDKPINFIGVQSGYTFISGKMLGEKTRVSEPSMVWETFFKLQHEISAKPDARMIGVSYSYNGQATYFAGIETDVEDERFIKWTLPAREYVVCSFEAEDFEQLSDSLGKMMKFTRSWLKEHGLRADGFFPELYYHDSSEFAYMEMWLPFKLREE